MLLNIARGGVVEYKSLYESLKSGHLGGLAMDVAWQDPFDPQDPILKLPNVIITPHVAGVTELSYTSMAKVHARYIHKIIYIYIYIRIYIYASQ